MNTLSAYGPHLLLELSTDIVGSLYERLGLVGIDNGRVCAALRSTIEQGTVGSDRSSAAWTLALDMIAQQSNRADAQAFNTWATYFPSGPAAEFEDIDTWEKVWPELTNRLRKAADPNGTLGRVADSYWLSTDSDTFGEALEEKLSQPLSAWDKRILATFGGAELSEEHEFFFATREATLRQELASFWASASRDLTEDDKEKIWREGQVTWIADNPDLTDRDFEAMRLKIPDDEFYRWAADYLRSKPKPSLSLPHPDVVLKYLPSQGTTDAE